MENPGMCLPVSVYIKIDSHAFTSWHNWGSPGLPAPSFPSFPHLQPLHLQYLNMSGVNVLAGAHHFVGSNNTFNTANTVSRVVLT